MPSYTEASLLIDTICRLSLEGRQSKPQIYQKKKKYFLTNQVIWCIISKSARAERTWRSRVAGRARTIGNRVYPKRVSRVQIPPSPPKKNSHPIGWEFFFGKRGEGFE